MDDLRDRIAFCVMSKMLVDDVLIKPASIWSYIRKWFGYEYATSSIKPSYLAECAYNIADAMINESEKRAAIRDMKKQAANDK